MNHPRTLRTNLIPYILLIAGFFTTLLLTWPGIMTSDSINQYHTAQSGVYSDHHPAMMSFVWRYLDMLYQGPGLMLLLHMLLLYSAAIYGVHIFYGSRLAYLFTALPAFPIVLIYSFTIWKDVGFAFSFLFAAMMLSNAIAKKRPLCLIEQILFWSVLFYGTSVKFQAQYCVPILIASYVIHHTEFFWNSKLKALLAFVLITLTFYGSFSYINNLLVPAKQKHHSWQYVKIYDLSAISIDSGHMYVPEFLHTKHFTAEKFQEIFNHKSVDDMVFPTDAIFRLCANEQEFHELWWQWAEVVTIHPFLYLKHRAMNMGYILLSIPGFQWVKYFLDNRFDTDSTIYKLLYYGARVVCYSLVGHIVFAICSVAYLLLGIIALRQTWAAFPLIMLNSIGLMMLSMLFFFSMAGTPRYTYIVVCLNSASHAFAWLCFKKKFRE